jgi:hypothetical protein
LIESNPSVDAWSGTPRLATTNIFAEPAERLAFGISRPRQGAGRGNRAFSSKSRRSIAHDYSG